MKIKTEYRTVSTHTLEGQREAERLHAAGWIIYSVGLFIVRFYRRWARRAGTGSNGETN